MANPCSTIIKFTSSDAAAVKKYYDSIIEYAGKEPSVTSVRLVTVLANAGLNPDSYTHRGEIDYMELDENVCEICTETDWEPNIQMFLAIKDKLGLDLTLAFRAEEFGNNIAYIYDAAHTGLFPEEVYIDSYGDTNGHDLDKINDYYDTSRAIDILEPIFNIGSNSIDDYIDAAETFNEEHEDEGDAYIGIHVFEYVNDLEGVL